jgi:hypothetical protein
MSREAGCDNKIPPPTITKQQAEAAKQIGNANTKHNTRQSQIKKTFTEKDACKRNQPQSE